MNTIKLKKNALFNPEGDTDLRHRRMIGGNTTNLNDFNNMRYKWVSDWYRQAMNNFWIPEEINLTQDTKDYPHLDQAERTAYDKILSFLVFLDSLQSNNLPTISEYITANEVNLCLHIQAFQECVHSQSYSYMLDSICSPEKRNEILYQWKTDGHLLKRNTFIGNCYNEFQESQDGFTLMKTLIANYILEGIYFYSGFMFFYNLSRNGKMSGSAQEIRYINRDENTHLWLFRNIILELKKEKPDLFTPDKVKIYEYMMREGVKQEIEWDMIRSCLEGVAFSIRQGIECIGVPPKTISVIGGGGRVSVWNQILADILDQTVYVYKDGEMLPALALGAAVLLAEGRIRGYSGFTDSLQGRERSDAYEPDPERAAFYDGLYRRYLDIYPAVKRYYHVQ